MKINATKRAGGGKRYDILHDGKLVEGGFFSLAAAEAALRYLLHQPHEYKIEMSNESPNHRTLPRQDR
jgi:hypothetical protein